MPGFCVNCGAPLTGRFCNNCGAGALASGAPLQVPVPPAAAQPGDYQTVNVPSFPAQPMPVAQVEGYQPVQVPAVATPKSSGLARVLLWVGGILLVLFMAGATATVYGVYWVKHKVSSYASSITGGSSDSMKIVAKGDSCRFLPKAALQKVLGVPIEKSAEIMEQDRPGCAYFTNQQAFHQLQRMAAEQAKRQSEEVNRRPGAKPDSLPALLKNANDLEGVVKALGISEPTADGKVFSFTIEHGADDDSWAGMRLTESAVPGFEEVSGVGDHAMIAAFGHAFYVQKGDAVITMSTMLVPDARKRGAELGRKIISNL
jgi:hypothetical protein